MAESKVKAKKKATKAKGFGKENYVDWYKKMLLMRKFEEKVGLMYMQQKFGGFCHLYIGQEAVAAGMSSALQKNDKVMTAYRCHAHPIAMGMDPRKIMAELYGKTTGCVKGKGGSMHIFDKEIGFIGGHGIVGGQIPLGAGIAMADQLKGIKAATICFMGDGAVRQGALHETFNMAMTWKLPVVFIVENNNYAMGTSVERTSNVTDLYKLGSAYEMPSYSVNAMSCEEVHTSIVKATDRARRGDGPTWLEFKTYRYKGHSMSDPQKYRTKEEVAEYKAQDPIEQMLTIISDNKYLTSKQLDKIQLDVKELVEECVKFAEDSPIGDASELYKDVYFEPDYPFIKE